MTTNTFDADKYENPFRSTNADSMSYEQIVDSWSLPFFMRRKMITEDFYLRTPLSLIISGARGTGKTMLFKYYCFQAQALVAEKSGKSILKFFEECKSISMYLKFDSYILQAFTDDEVGNRIFTHFFELVVCESYVEFLNLLREKNELSEGQYENIEKEIYGVLEISGENGRLEYYVEQKIAEVYDYINERKITGKEFDTKKFYTFRSLSYKVKKIFCDVIPELNEVIFLWVIDQGEDFLEFEQKTMNGFIKTLNMRMNRDIFLRLGTREPKIKTYETINRQEFLMSGRDYEFKDINYYTINSDERADYKEWLIQIAKNRLEKIDVFKKKELVNIENFLGQKENQCEEAKKWAANKKEHFKWCLKDAYSEELYEALKVKDNPLLEMMNIWWYNKGIPIEEIKIGLEGYLKGKSEEEDRKDIERRYRENFSANKMAFLYLLSSKYKREKQYYSFNTFRYLSVGNVCNFIKLCREAFDNAYFQNKQDLFSGTISAKAQHAAAMSVAYDEIEKVRRIPKFGDELYALSINLGNLFNEYHSDVELRNMEANQFSVIYKGKLVEDLIDTALTWGVFLHKTSLQTLDASGNKGTVYTLNRMFCPLFGISYRSKGRYKEIFDEEVFLELTQMQKKKISTVISSYAVKETIEQPIVGQISLPFS
ncbi:MAG: hypothetical protein NC293_00435 [Roseburia sp.]|nr:hypothetical protein [Roseburia sp.]